MGSNVAATLATLKGVFNLPSGHTRALILQFAPPWLSAPAVQVACSVHAHVFALLMCSLFVLHHPGFPRLQCSLLAPATAKCSHAHILTLCEVPPWLSTTCSGLRTWEDSPTRRTVTCLWTTAGECLAGSVRRSSCGPRSMSQRCGWAGVRVTYGAVGHVQ